MLAHESGDFLLPQIFTAVRFRFGMVTYHAHQTVNSDQVAAGFQDAIMQVMIHDGVKILANAAHPAISVPGEKSRLLPYGEHPVFDGKAVPGWWTADSKDTSISIAESLAAHKQIRLRFFHPCISDSPKGAGKK